MAKKNCESLEISTLIKEIDQCVDTLNTTWQCCSKTAYRNIVKQGRYQVLNIINRIKTHSCHNATASKEDLRRDVFHVQVEYDFEETKIAHLRKEWTQQQNKMAKMQESLYKKCRLLTLHSGYCSTQGSALCSILAVLTEQPNVVEIFLSDVEKYLIDFVKIADGCLFSFIRSYVSDIPLTDSTDYKFIVALFTVMAHVSKLSEGCLFLVKREECQKALWSLIHALPQIQHDTAETLIITLWKILYNVSLEEDGKIFLQECSEMPETLEDYIRRKYHPEIHKHTLKTFEEISTNIVSKEFLDKITTRNSIQRLKELSGSMYNLVKIIPKRILQNISQAAAKFLAQEQIQQPCPSTGLIPCDCDTKPPITPQDEPSKSLGSITTKNIIRIPPDQSQACIRITHRFTRKSKTNMPSTPSIISSGQSELQHPESCPLCRTPCKEMFLSKPQFYNQSDSSKLSSTSCPFCKVFGPIPSTNSSVYEEVYRPPTPIPTVRHIFQANPSQQKVIHSFEQSCRSYKSDNKNPYPQSLTSKEVHVSRFKVRLPKRTDDQTQTCAKNHTNKHSSRTKHKVGGMCPSYCVLSCKIKESPVEKKKSKKRPFSYPAEQYFLRKRNKCIATSFSDKRVYAPLCTALSSHSAKHQEENSEAIKVFSDNNTLPPVCPSNKQISNNSPTDKTASVPHPNGDEKIFKPTENDNGKTLAGETTTTNSFSHLMKHPKTSLIPIRHSPKKPSSAKEDKGTFCSKDSNRSTCSCLNEIKERPTFIPIATFKTSAKSSSKSFYSPIITINNDVSSSSTKPTCSKSDTISERAKPSREFSKYRKKSPNFTDTPYKSISGYLQRNRCPKFKQKVSPLNCNDSKCISSTENESSTLIIEADCTSKSQDTSEATTVDLITENLSSTIEKNIFDEPSTDTSKDNDICSCGSASNKQLVPWSPIDHMIVSLGERDRRVFNHTKTMKIINRIQNRTTKKQQRVSTRIKIPNLPFHTSDPNS